MLEAVEAARRIAPIIAELKPDELTRAVIEALADCQPLSISEVYRRVKSIRGKASRSTVASRLKELEKRGIAVNLGGDKRPRYTLRVCLQNE